MKYFEKNYVHSSSRQFKANKSFQKETFPFEKKGIQRNRFKSEFFQTAKITNENSKSKRLKKASLYTQNNQAKLALSYEKLLKIRVKKAIRRFFIEGFMPHFSATFFLAMLVGIRNNILLEICFLDNIVCNVCSIDVKIFYMLTVISLEYLIPILYGYYICFYTNSFRRFSRMSWITMILYYTMLFFWFYIWNDSLYILFPEKTVDNFVYASLVLINSIIILPYVKYISKLTWKSLILRTKYNTILLLLGCSAFILFINVLHWFQEGLKNKSEAYQNIYQIFLVIFCVSYENSLLYIMIKQYPQIKKEWNNNNSPILFIAKNIFIFSYAIRIANMAVLNSSQFGFYLQILTFTQYIIEILFGQSFFSFLLNYAKSRIRNSKKKQKTAMLKLFKVENENKEELECLRIMCYQKFEFFLCYWPRLIYIIFFNKWSLSQPFQKLVKACSFDFNDNIKIQSENILILVTIDIVISFSFLRKMIKNQKILNYMKFETENLPFHYKVVLFSAFQICFEYWIHYYLNMIFV